MILKVNLTKHIQHTVTIWRGYHKLTDLECDLLCYIIQHYLDIKSQVSEELFNQNFLTTEFRKTACAHFNIKQPQYSVYLSSLVSKKCLSKVDGTYTIPLKFIPSTKIEFEFRYE